MTIFLDESGVARLLTMQDGIDAVEEVFCKLGEGKATNVPRVRAPLNEGTLRITAAVLHYSGYYGIKVSSTTVFGRNAGRLFCLYREKGGELCAVLQVFGLGALRTGAASAVATRHLARQDACVLGIIGTGRQAVTQVEAIAMVRPLEEVRVFGRDEQRRERFCKEIAARLNLDVRPVTSAKEAIEDCDIAVTATTSTSPVLLGHWLKPGTHVNAIGANYEYRRELDLQAVDRATVIAADDPDQARYESSDLSQAVEAGTLCWDRIVPLGEIVAGRTSGRTSGEDITLFKSLGVAAEDVALALRAYQKALQEGIGRTLPNLAG
jgi:ornithine cyclodeaminase/alanine dehydrogenase-like protein (mu-crystallin family)